MGTQQKITYGNLALAIEPREAPRFTVVEGGLKHPSQPAGAMRPVSSCAKLSGRFYLFASVALLTALILFAVFSVLSNASAINNAVSQAELTQITVQSGDTLWGIASMHAVDGLTTQQTVDALKDWNALDDAALEPGQTLMVAAS